MICLLLYKVDYEGTFVIISHCVLLMAQVLKGSHLCGRIEHIKVGGQIGADMERVEQISKVSTE